MFTKPVNYGKSSSDSQIIPVAPVSPSTGIGLGNSMVTPPPQLMPKAKKEMKDKHAIHRQFSENLEEKHCLCMNLFFCFVFPLVCRRTPLDFSDLPTIHTKDLGDTVFDKGKKGFAKRYAKYLEQKIKYDEEKTRNPDLKEPSKPSLLFVLWFDVGHWDLFAALTLILISIGFQIVQPVFMRQLVTAVQKRATEPDTPFPFLFAILLCICPFSNSFFDSWGNRILYHYSVQIRSTMNGLVYDKIFYLDMTSTSNIDKGKVLSLVSNDARNASEQITQMFIGLFLPVQFFVPFGFVVYQLKWTGLVGLGVLIVLGSSQFIFGTGINRSLTAYMISNDQRNRMTNETLQGIKVVKLTGLESVFIDRVIQSRAEQLQSTFYFTLFLELASGFMKVLPIMVNFSTICAYVGYYHLAQKRFAVEVIPTIGFLQMMTQPCSQAIMYIQAFTIVFIGVGRIRDFLIIPNVQEVQVKPPADESDAIVITNGAFKWSCGQSMEDLSKEDRHEKEGKLRIMKEIEEKSKRAAQGKAKGTNSINRPSPSPSAITTPQTSMFSFSSSAASPERDATPALSPDPNAPTLRNVNVRLKKGSLTMVVGGVGCGKSSLACAMIGEIPLVGGELRRQGSFSYCAQTAWINNNTVRGNIIFGCDFDEERYLEVVKICALEADIRSFPGGDLTAIGEKGANLSGGQKARIQLARCVYSNRDILVMDDPLSAVDVHVGKYLFQECICKYLKGRTRILMTNQLQYLDYADNIVVLANGEVIGQGTYSELKAMGLDFSEYILGRKDKEKKKEKKDKVNNKNKKLMECEVEVDLDEPSGGSEGEKLNKGGEGFGGGSLGGVLTLSDLERGDGQFTEEEVDAAQRCMTEEEFSKKSISPKTYCAYLLTLMPLPLLFCYFCVTLVAEGGVSFAGYWLGIIGNAKKWPDVEFWMKIRTYGILAAIVFGAVMVRAISAAFAVHRSNRIVHDRCINHVIRAPPAFFDTTPMGRILNRLTAEMSSVDQFLHTYFMTNIYFWLNMLGTIVVVSINTPFFLYIGIPTVAIYSLLLFFYSPTSRILQRADSISRSPVVAVLTETLSGAGLPTIKAYALQDAWQRKFNAASDVYASTKVIFKCGQKWATVYSSITSTLFMTGVVIIGWFLMGPADLGVAINSGITFANFGVLIIMQNVELDSRMVSYERVHFYSTRLPQENNRALVSPPKKWPMKGKIVFDHVSFRYRPGLPFVLRDVSFTIQPGEKIGVCGRTGAGKSSLLFAMFRLVELDPKLMPQLMDVETGFPMETPPDEKPNSGRIFLDGFDISKVALSRIRQSISIIPQDPTLFTGSVRYNLDLSYKCSDEEVQNVIDLIEMRQTIEEMPEGLDTPIAESGSNFSCGQRQLLCFGRAVLNQSRVVILDEATAAVDVETDAKIQNMVRKHLKEQTVFVIAHRLNTIINSDRIMVLDSGRIVEFDSPANLLNNPSSAFNSLIKSASQEESE